MAGYGDLPYGDSPYKDEVRDFSGTPTSGLVPLSVVFTDLTSGSTIWDWDFGDGSLHSHLQNPTHIYTVAGTYTVILTIDGPTVYTKLNYITVNLPTVATPIISPIGGTFDDVTQVSISCATPSSTIYYTTDGSTPTNLSTLYTDPFDIYETHAIKAKAYAIGYNPSLVVSNSFILLNKYANIFNIYTGTDHAGTYVDPFSFDDLVAHSQANPSNQFYDIWGIRVINSVANIELHVNANTWRGFKPDINGPWRIGNLGSGDILI